MLFNHLDFIPSILVDFTHVELMSISFRKEKQIYTQHKKKLLLFLAKLFLFVKLNISWIN